MNLKDRIAATAKQARDQREAERLQAAAEANETRRLLAEKAVEALIGLLSDDNIHQIVEAHMNTAESQRAMVRFTTHSAQLVKGSPR